MQWLLDTMAILLLYAVLLHAQPAIVEFYDWLLYEVSPSTQLQSRESRRDGEEAGTPDYSLNPRIKRYPLVYFGNTVINFYVVSPFIIV